MRLYILLITLSHRQSMRVGRVKIESAVARGILTHLASLLAKWPILRSAGKIASVEEWSIAFRVASVSRARQVGVARMSGRGKGKSAKKAVSRSAKAGLQVSRDHRCCSDEVMQRYQRRQLRQAKRYQTVSSQRPCDLTSHALQFPVGRIARYLKKGKVIPLLMRLIAQPFAHAGTPT